MSQSNRNRRQLNLRTDVRRDTFMFSEIESAIYCGFVITAYVFLCWIGLRLHSLRFYYCEMQMTVAINRMFIYRRVIIRLN